MILLILSNFLLKMRIHSLFLPYFNLRFFTFFFDQTGRSRPAAVLICDASYFSTVQFSAVLVEFAAFWQLQPGFPAESAFRLYGEYLDPYDLPIR